MPKLYLVMGGNPPSHADKDDLVVNVDFSRFSLSDISTLMKLVSELQKEHVDDNKLNEAIAKLVPSLNLDTMMHFDDVKICADKSMLGIAKRSLAKKNKDVDPFGCD